ncbi:hypothetical protein BPS13_0054 [Bacillus phage BPS13]|uniref:Uncharacterized protein n=2 Tax=Wphvirus BPS13 TaxID=1987727 RepID=A0A173GBJ0_9CAUD|nr:hypothetical protein BPS13_0054 [Bacillus phage BPS13]YP_009281974.1 hypothetical protein SALINJAH_20 [Bacillus phage SalinJah]AEZ50233.1 hypothetical protein BPS13_0054 [Bacillus phage BPS13]ANH50667.1 hypothetical protein SALINJAH_20 [Bacillus phage SalinJah]
MKTWADIKVEVGEEKVRLLNEQIRACTDYSVQVDLISIRTKQQCEIKRWKEVRKRNEDNSR